MTLGTRPKVGVGIFVIKESSFLLGKRKGGLGDGTWALPGGHLEFGESFEQCAAREVLEETGLCVSNITCGPYTNDIFLKNSKHYITIYTIADYQAGEPLVMEPNKCEAWQWFSGRNLPTPLFLPLHNLLMQLHFFDLKNASLLQLITSAPLARKLE